MVIGLLMVAGEDDILEATLDSNARLVDCFYALDGSDPGSMARDIIEAHPKCAAYTHDDDLMRPRYPDRPVDGYRQHLLEQATQDHGHGHWYLLLHGDELWTGLPGEPDAHDGWNFPLPPYFPRDGEPWDYTRGPIEQLHWHLLPGYPEFRMFRGAPGVRYIESQHFNVTPQGIQSIGWCDEPIRHYLYRAPEVQRIRAARHMRTGFDLDNYRHIITDDAVYWDDDRISSHRQHPWFQELAC